MKRSQSPLLFFIGALTIGLAAAPTWAQSNLTGAGIGRGSQGPAGDGGQQNGKAAVKRPDALPGTRTQKSEVTPADRLASDMAPNEALFDGINRGDMAYVKDAISRGADLSARNVLGLTPIDLSVDLGRNDITFLLLSLRGADSSAGAPAVPGKSAKAMLQAAAKADAKQAKSPRAVREAAPAPPAKPKLFANDGGAPVPNAGFLGFGTQR
jgi:hypothetical protein